MSNQNLVDYDQLKTITKRRSPADVAAALTSVGIKFFRTGKYPWTTIQLINAAGGLEHNDEKPTRNIKIK